VVGDEPLDHGDDIEEERQMGGKRRNHGAGFKVKVVLAAIKGDKTLAELFEVGWRHVQTLMDKMGIEALYRKPRLSDPHPGRQVWPYLLRDVVVTRPKVWTMDITYIPLTKGFAYLVAIIGGYSRRVLAWRLSNCDAVYYGQQDEKLAD
jgi:hypothetical protein